VDELWRGLLRDERGERDDGSDMLRVRCGDLQQRRQRDELHWVDELRRGRVRGELGNVDERPDVLGVRCRRV